MEKFTKNLERNVSVKLHRLFVFVKIENFLIFSVLRRFKKLQVTKIHGIINCGRSKT